MEETKVYKEPCCFAAKASLAFEMDGTEPMTIHIFVDWTTARQAMFIASCQCCGIYFDHVLDNVESVQVTDEWFARQMVKVIMKYEKAVILNTRVVREIESERTIYYGFNKTIKWAEFPERLKKIFTDAAG